MAELEIAKQLKNGTKLSKEQASEILELMKNNKVDINTTPENISNDREKEIMDQLEKGFKKQKNIKENIEPDSKVEDSKNLCPIGCKTKLIYSTFLDHMRECEKNHRKLL